MGKRMRPRGLNAYFHCLALNLEPGEIRERHLRAYLEQQLTQVDAWLYYLADEPAGGLPPSPQEVSHWMDVSYLQAVRQAIHESLQALP